MKKRSWLLALAMVVFAGMLFGAFYWTASQGVYGTAVLQQRQGKVLVFDGSRQIDVSEFALPGDKVHDGMEVTYLKPLGSDIFVRVGIVSKQKMCLYRSWDVTWRGLCAALLLAGILWLMGGGRKY